MNLIRPVLALGLLLLAVDSAAQSTSGAQAPRQLTAAEKSSLIKVAEAALSAFDTGDAEAIIKRTSRLIEKVVPRAQFEEITRTAIKQMLAQGIRFESNKNGEPSECYATTSGDVCFLPRVSIIRMGAQRVRSEAWFICVKEEGEWCLLDSASVQKNPQLLWKLIPDLPQDVKLPPGSKVVIDENGNEVK